MPYYTRLFLILFITNYSDIIDTCLHKEIKEIEPAKHIWLSGREAAYLIIQEDTLSQDYSTRMA